MIIIQIIKYFFILRLLFIFLFFILSIKQNCFRSHFFCKIIKNSFLKNLLQWLIHKNLIITILPFLNINILFFYLRWLLISLLYWLFRIFFEKNFFEFFCTSLIKLNLLWLWLFIFIDTFFIEIIVTNRSLLFRLLT